MSRIEWNKSGERFFEVGVDRGVLYPRVGPGVPWNGLVSVNETVTGGDHEALYYDGVKYLDVMAGEDFQATLEAYSAPLEFAASDGVKFLSPGFSVSQQPRRPFNLAYRTLLGNDLQGEEHGYKIHLVYNCTATPSSRSHKTLAENPDPSTRSWTINTVPPPATTFRPTAHVVIDSTLTDPYLLQELETVLYGRNASSGFAAKAPTLPSVAQIVLLLDNRISEFIESTV